jgi:hypothetical protein
LNTPSLFIAFASLNSYNVDNSSYLIQYKGIRHIIIYYERVTNMPTISMFRGIKVYMNYSDHQPPHFHAFYGGEEVVISIDNIEVITGSMQSKQLKMLLGWAAFHQEELKENWELARKRQELFQIAPLA